MKRTRGLGFVYQRPGTKVWWIQYSRAHKRRRESSGSVNRSDAVKLLKQRIADAVDGKPAGPTIEKTTVADLAQILIDDYVANERRSLKRARISLNHLTDYFQPDGRVIAIGSDRIVGYIAHRQQEGAARATINRELAALKRAFRLARRAKRVAEVPDISLLSENNARQGFLERSDFDRLLAALPDYLRPPVTGAYFTGWRVHAEILTRRVSDLRDIDSDRAVLILDREHSKNGEPREFPVGEIEELRAVLAQARDRALRIANAAATPTLNPYLFVRDNGEPIKDFRSAWKSACQQAGLVAIPHDFRRTAVRNLSRAGVGQKDSMDLTGHRTISVFQRYHIGDEITRAASGRKLAAFSEQERERSAESAAKVVVMPQLSHRRS
jgi:integrase